MDVRRSGPRRSAMAHINVTPFVDVMLVLLIIFMVTAPMLDQGLEIDLPQVQQTPGLPADIEPMVVVLQRNGQISIDRVEVEGIGSLERVVRQALQNRPDLQVFLEADQTVAYGLVVQVMAAIKQAGVDKLGMVTRLPED
ncbi:protein TolR [Pelovirga terrestris]|uniref:Protein TolR n=1 Tax=Pelovirga terrestris TaxID=2771352 RepID=A0A8J6QWM8_9BACT|nr:protein TolR [Pelovirga terrestris]MBD1399918.1 protein TolR [Pelovirga terrestris]